MPNREDYLTVREAAEVLGVSDQRIRELIRTGKLPSYREFDRHPRVLRQAVLDRKAGIDPDPRLTVKQIAERLGVSEQTVRHYIKRGNLIGGVRVNHSWRFAEEDFARFIAPVHGVRVRDQPVARRTRRLKGL